MSSENLCFNGINGSTGEYLLPPMSASEVVAIALGQKIDSRLRKDLASWADRKSESHFEVVAGVDPEKLEETGWGVIFTHNADPAIREALSPLLELRKLQASKHRGTRYKEFVGGDGYRPGESSRDFLSRHGVEASQPADPDRGVPYYLLIVGSPEEIPFRFQYLLDVQYAVGRIWFETIQEYSDYAQSVVSAETRKVVVGRKATFFGVQNADDPATSLSATEMVGPLSNRMPKLMTDRRLPPWEISSILGADATKERLSKTLGASQLPSLLFTASHGMGFPKGDPRQLPHQGALLCQDWPGPRDWRGSIPEAHYFSADDVPSDANLQGLIAFHFACYGAGTPELDDFSYRDSRDPVQIAPRPFLANLPRKLLSRGALAVIGHVERAWGYSFYWNRIGSQLQTFESALYEVMEGKPIGKALEYFNTRYASLSTQLSDEIEAVNKYSKEPDEQFLAGTWTAHNDARSYIILGDPAVRLPLVQDGESETRPKSLVVAVAPKPSVSSDQADFAAQDRQKAVETREDQEVLQGAFGLLDQIAATEQRYSSEPVEPASFEAGSRVSPLRRANDPQRLASRLKGLGVPDSLVERLAGSDVSFGSVEAEIPVDESNPDDRILERILGRNDMVDAPRFLLRGAKASQATGRVRILTGSGKLRGWGTGSLVSPRLLLTNNHVLADASAADSSLIEFNVQDGTDGKPMKQVDFRLLPKDFFITDQKLDFTLVAVAEKSADGTPLSDFGFNPGTTGDDPILASESVNIVQHPSGRPKQIALRENTVTRILSDFIHYQTDTEPGSSGSPVFNDQWDLVALHHSGVPARDANGNILARDGSIWKPAMGDNQINWVANEGVRISRILEFVRRFPLTAPRPVQLRKELFDRFVKSSNRRSLDATETAPEGSSAVVPPSPVATVSIPLTLNITLDLGSGEAPRISCISSSPPPSSVPSGSPSQEEAISIDPDYDSREGYDPDFLGNGSLRVPRPKLSTAQITEASRLTAPSPGADRYELKYHHHSVVMNRKRRLAFYTAVNIDGKLARDIKRETDKWFYDSRIPKQEQIGEELYSANPFDRGHLVRRLDPAWGNSVRLAKVANDDTFHFTNCSPQHENFNQGKSLWQGVENFLLDRATGADQKLTVFTGPVFRDEDPEYRGVKIPLEFWKVAVLVGDDGKLNSVAFLVTQADLVESVVQEGAIDAARMFQTSVREIEKLTGLNFGRLRNFDTQSVDSFSVEESQMINDRIPLNSLESIRLPGGRPSDPAGTTTEFSISPSDPWAQSRSGRNPKESVIGTDLSYYLLAYDRQAQERQDHPAGLISQQILDALDSEPITDVFLFSHGWRGDVPAAREQYQAWLKTMASCDADRAKIRQKRPGFRPMLIGVHWPSEPWGDESISSGVSFSPGTETKSTKDLVADYARRLGDSQAIRDALGVIFEADRTGMSPKTLPSEVLSAYKSLEAQVGLPKGGLGAAPGADWDGFNPESIYESALRDNAFGESMNFGQASRGSLLAPLRVLSFWKMKDLARHVGEQAIHGLLSSMQGISQGRDVRYHLAGHSFGCIVASSAIAGPPGTKAQAQPVDSLVLLQGALSIFSFCSRIPDSSGKPGYFHRLVSNGLVRGSIVTTQSRYDTAVGTWYPLATRVAGQVEFASVDSQPKYGAVGAYGIHGPDLEPVQLPMNPIDAEYRFRPGCIYNVDSSDFINQGGGFSGAHSDIRKPQVAHAVWSAIIGS